MADKRITVTIPSAHHAYLLEWWSTVSGRPLSNLASALLEDGIKQALRDGTVPRQAIEAVERLIDASMELHAEDFQAQEEQARERGL